MTKTLLTQILLTMMLLQSISTLADIHQSHQLGTEHLAFEEHNHDQNDGADSNNVISGKIISDKNVPVDQYDCHHCCHCHSIHITFMVGTDTLVSLPAVPCFLPDTGIQFVSAIPTSRFRPPRA